jgi:hypothetical protein
MTKSQEQQPRPVEQKSEEPSTNKVNKLEKEAKIDLLDYMTYISCEDHIEYYESALRRGMGLLLRILLMSLKMLEKH